MVRRCLTTMCAAATLVCPAQEQTPYIGGGLLRGSAAISPGFLLNAPVTNIYVNGKVEYFVEERISFRGEGFWYVDSQQDDSPIARNSQLAFGPFYHWVHGRLDLALGMEAGISLAQPAIPVIATYDPDLLRVLPNVAACAGLTFAVWDYFHFFLDARYVHARYTGSNAGTIPLDEVIVSGGLGWQLRLKK